MNTIETEFAIDDVVYVANEYGLEREIIKAIKITGTKQKIEYGIKNTGGMLMSLYHGDNYRWFTSKNIFMSETEALKAHEALKAKADKKKEQEAQEKRQKRLRELEEERAALERGEDYEPDGLY